MTDLAGRLAALTPDQRAQLAARLAATKPRAPAQPPALAPASAIAIIGVGCRFPGAPSPEAFWEGLTRRFDAVREVPADRWDAARYFSADPQAPGSINARRGGFLDGIDQFDPGFFGLSPREAMRMDPQQRILLETAWEALEDAGQLTDRLAGGATGVFIGAQSHSSDYYLMQARDEARLDTYTATGTAHSILANRISFLLDLRGPSLAIDTACSSSLVAVHMACQSLRTGECDLALAGGVNLMLTPDFSICLAKLEMLAPDGRCKTFDHRANGFVRGEGCGVVVLKRLADATRDGDPILAVILGSAVNQDGASNGLTAPNGLAQEAVIRQALKIAQLQPEAVDYVETHGTGTVLGDPIEVEALVNVLRPGGAPGNPLVLGAVKTNIGHLEAASGIAGLIKAALSLDNCMIPANLHLESLNPHLADHAASIVLPTEARPWPRGERQRVAGVSAFGFGGTNAHVVVAEAPAAATPVLAAPVLAAAVPTPMLFPVSARSGEALRRLAEALIAFLESAEGQALAPADLAHTAGSRRPHYDHRLCAVGADATEWAASLRTQLEAIGDGRDAHRSTLNGAARLYVEGAALDWTRLSPPAGRSVRLPRHPWRRQRYWLSPSAGAAVTPETAPGSEAPPDWFYALNWRLVARPGGENPMDSPSVTDGAADIGRTLVFDDDSGLGDAVAAALRDQGADCVLLDARSTHAALGQGGGAEALDLGGRRAEAVIYLAARTGGDLAGACERPLGVIQALIRQSIVPRNGVWLVTRGGQPPGDMRISALSQSILWGLGRGVAIEAPDLQPTLIDLDPAIQARAAALALIDEIAHRDGEDQIVPRGAGRYVPRLERIEPSASGTAPLRVSGCHLITGGLGGLGSLLALELARAGAGALVLLVNQPPPDRADWASLPASGAVFERVETIRAIEALGVAVHVAALDLTDPEALPGLFRTAAITGAKLRGVWHAATAFSEHPLVELDESAVRSMIKVKAEAAVTLHELTQDWALDHFVLFSSTTGLWGARGLAHYAAANACLDALAYIRRSRGLPATVIDWGLWAATRGLSPGQRDRAGTVGLRPMEDGLAFACLRRVLASGATQTIVADVDWSRFKPAYETRRARPMLSGLGVAATPSPRGIAGPRQEARGDNTPLVDRLMAAAADERGRILKSVVGRGLAEILDLDPEAFIDPRTGFFELGMDSLTSAQLRRRLEDALARPLPSTLVFKYPTIEALVSYLSETLSPAAARSPAPVAAEAAPPAVAPAVPVGDGRDPDDAEATEDELFARLAARLSEARLSAGQA